MYVYVHQMHAWYPQWSEQGVRCHGIAVMDGVELGLLEEQEVFLATELYLSRPSRVCFVSSTTSSPVHK